jgi:hypothetical protein
VIEWLDIHAGSAQVMLALVLVLVTTYYAVQTHRQVSVAEAAIREMQWAREAQAKAYVTLELWPWDRNMALFDIAIRNHGAGAARDIHVVFEPDFLWPAGGIGGTGMISEIERSANFRSWDRMTSFSSLPDATTGSTRRMFPRTGVDTSSSLMTQGRLDSPSG